jgi:uncharacterized protein YggU (UPF0235/DUF167 family)
VTAELTVAVTPRSARAAVGPMADGVLRVRVTRPATDGEANRAVLTLLGDALGIAPTRLAIVAGERGRRKRIVVGGIDAEELARRLRRIGLD